MTSLVRKTTASAAVATLMSFALAGMVPPTIAQEEAPRKAPTAKAKTAKKAAPAADEDEAPAPKAKSARSAPDPTHRVPMYFGGLSLTAEQKESIYKLEARYQPQIQEAEKKADDLRERLMADCEDVLTPAQKRALAEARQTAADRRKAAADRRKAASEGDAEDEEKPEPRKAEASARKPATID
ncbi:hypothetical protein [Paludisphaera soli]|uniref:hypothetical protein n=1 Tax=Paludisphaera soli TaxID=2712865 RepID=UPI0013EA422D|nr:hypothetical protein [Paludisphaera soli]